MSNIPGYDDFLRAAQRTNDTVRVGVMPWEANSLMQHVFSDGNLLQPMPKQPRLSTEILSSSSTLDRPPVLQSDLKEQIKQKVPRVRPSTNHLTSSDPEASRQQAINSWLVILKMDLEESITGRQIQRILEHGHDQQKEADLVIESVELSCRIKSANTLTMRAASLGQLLNWCTKNQIPPLPIKEEVVFDYMRSEEMKSRGATNGSRRIEALNFSGAVFGVEGAFLAATSARIKGSAVDKYLTKNPRQPALELSDLQLFGLERFLADKENDPAERVSAGSLCFLTYGRCRSSDVNRLVKLERHRRQRDRLHRGQGEVSQKCKNSRAKNSAFAHRCTCQGPWL